MQTGAMVHLSSNGFVDAFVSAAVGQSFVYATGDLAFERHLAVKMADAFAGVELDAMANLALAMSDVRKVCLTQRRISPNVFEYIATKRDPESEIPRKSRPKFIYSK